MALPSLTEIVTALPEIYQPIWQHPEFDTGASRKTDDQRLGQILSVHEALAQNLKRPVRVLDLGCAQGWFCFNLAKAGAHVTGIDMLAPNIAVCKMLQLENRNLKVNFELQEIEQTLSWLKEDQFDLVLGLSVFHHLCYHNGKDQTRQLISAILRKIPSGIFEFALTSEPVKWAGSLPEKPDYLIEDTPFIHLLSKHETHLSQVHRPLYFCSHYYWYLDKTMEKFQSWEKNDRNRRRYFFGNNIVVKVYGLTGENAESNSNALLRAAKFLTSPPPAGYPNLPKVLLMGHNSDEVWLVQEKIAGEPLINLITQSKPYNAHKIILDILRQLTALERNGTYHADLRVWNILITPQAEAILIDYNEISEIKRDCVWPDSPFLAFFIFLHEVLTQSVSYTEPLRQPFISPYNLPEPYRSWGAKFWQKPSSEWSFAFLLESLERLPGHPNEQMQLPSPDPNALALWIEKIELYLDVTTVTLRSLEQPFRHLIDTVATSHRALDARIQKLEEALLTKEKKF